MKNLLTFIVSIGFFISAYSQITNAEYFIDVADPGVGSATSLTVTTSNTIAENFTIATTGLTEGLHVLHIRVKGTSNVWSLYKRAYFYVQSPSTNGTPKNIVAAEYYIDIEQAGGLGNQTALTLTAGMTINEAFTIPTNGLTEGLHVLHIRIKDADDTWSLYKRAYFYVQSPSANGTPKNIVAAEYYIDDDNLGVGNQNTLTVTDGMTINEAFTIPSNGLTAGLHVLHIRVKDADNTWGLYKRAYFYIHTSNAFTPSPIVAAEYFIGTDTADDPGTGNANPLTVTQGMTIEEAFTISIPTSLANNDYYLHIRVQDQDGTWSLYKRALFTVDSALAIEELSSDDFKVFPNPVQDVIHVNFTKFSNYTVAIYDITGKEIFLEDEVQQTNSFNISSLSAGIYILKIRDNERNQVQNIKIIKS